MFNKIFIAIASSLLVVACTTTATPDPRFVVKAEPVIPAQVILSTQKTTALEDTLWQLVALTKGVNANQIQDGAFLNFQSLGLRIKGSTGCNRLMGSYKVQEQFLKLSDIASTKIFCPSGGIIQESLFIEALSDTRGWRIESGHLYLLNERGETVAVFEVR